ncbi:Sodium-dependent phosphate transport protein 2A, partial [Durusdinium trenchii]
MTIGWILILPLVVGTTRCHLGLNGQAEDVALLCGSAGECLALAAQEARKGLRCKEVLIKDVRHLVAAAYISTPSTLVSGIEEEPLLPLRNKRFLPSFLATLPAAATASLLQETPLVAPATRAAGSEDEEGPEPIFLTYGCELCEIMADDAEMWLRQLNQTYSQPGPASGDPFLKELRLPGKQQTTSAMRIFPPLLYKLEFLQGKFGVLVADLEAWYLSMLLSLGVKDKTHTVHMRNRWLGINRNSQMEVHLATVRSAIPHRADWIFIPPTVLDGVGLDASTGQWDLHADLQLMDTISGALATGGHIILSIMVGEDCFIMRDDKAFRVYGPNLLQQLLEKWETKVRMEHPANLRVSYGPCRSRPAVLVLRSKWDRHPASLLTVRRIDIMPKLIYAVHRRQIGLKRERRDPQAGQWAEDVYFNCGISMGALAEHCAFDINIVAEPCRKKFGKEAFEHGFNFLIDSMDYLGFTRAISDVRLDQNDILLNGAHRVAIALAMGFTSVPVTPTALHDGITGGVDQTVMLNNLEKLHGHDHGRSLMSSLFLELIAREQHPQAIRQLGVAFVWPKAPRNFTEKAEAAIFENFFLVMPHWEVKLRGEGCFNLLQLLYSSHAWSKQPEYVLAKARRSCGADYAKKTTGGDLIVFELRKDELPVLEKV